MWRVWARLCSSRRVTARWFSFDRACRKNEYEQAVLDLTRPPSIRRKHRMRVAAMRKSDDCSRSDDNVSLRHGGGDIEFLTNRASIRLVHGRIPRLRKLRFFLPRDTELRTMSWLSAEAHTVHITVTKWPRRSLRRAGVENPATWSTHAIKRLGTSKRWLAYGGRERLQSTIATVILYTCHVGGWKSLYWWTLLQLCPVAGSSATARACLDAKKKRLVMDQTLEARSGR